MDVRRGDLERNQRNGSPVQAFIEVVQTSQDVVLRRLEVLRIETERRVEALRDETMALAFAGLLAFSAWILMLAAAVVFLSRLVGPGLALAILGLANGLLAFAVQRRARRQPPGAS